MSQITLTSPRTGGLRARLPVLFGDAAGSCLLAAGSLPVLLAQWGTLDPGALWPVLALILGWILCRAARLPGVRPAVGWGLRLLPWAVLLLGGRDLVQGLLLWLNCIITLWNRLHQGGAALFAAAATQRSVLLWSLAMGLALGQGIHWLVSRRKTAVCGLFWAGITVLSLLTGTHLAGACAVGFSGFLGLWMLERGKTPRRREVRLWSLTLAALLLSTLLLPAGEVESVTAFRADVTQRLHALRFGREQLPEGHLDRAAILNRDSGEVLHIHAGQEKNLYLRAYVGAVYADGVWTLLPDSAYGGEYSGMLEWLGEQGFDPLTQSAAYYALCTGDDLPESSHLTVDVKDGARCYLYLPGSVSTLSGTGARALHDARWSAGGLFGARFYTAEETSPGRPAELTVRENWVAQPETEAQRKYTEAESVYRAFVYDNYTQADGELTDLIQQLFWDDAEDTGDGIYAALSRVREVLRQRTTYTREEVSADGTAEPIRDFLIGSRRGNAMLYASAAVQALRVRGIPARYVEGYYLSASAIQKGGAEGVTLTGQDAHAWAEVYFDGIGWLPVDVTPGYYYDAVTLQQMISLPDTVKKTAALEDPGDASSPVREENGAGGDLPQPVEVLRDTAAIFLGLLALAAMVLTGMFLVLEVLRQEAEMRAERAFRKAGPAARAELLRRRLYRLLELWNVEGCLGWNAPETDAQLARRVPGVLPGDYCSVTALLERALYGGEALYPHELRTVRALLDKLSAPVRDAPRHNLRIRYSRLRFSGEKGKNAPAAAK